MQLELPEPAIGVVTLLPTQTRIGPFTIESSFLSTPEGKTASVFVSNPPHASYKLADKFIVSDLLLGAIVFFSAGKLTSMNLFVTSDAQNWNDWSEPEALKQRDLLEQLLTGRYGSTRSFWWGEVVAVYDARGGSSALVIRYALTSSGLSIKQS